MVKGGIIHRKFKKKGGIFHMRKQMRRKDRQVFGKDIEDILINGEYGTLSTIGDNGYPYIVPLNYIYYNNSIYFHCAKDGHKLENIRQSNKVCFCVVTDTDTFKR